jgi:hypothetical protein
VTSNQSIFYTGGALMADYPHYVTRPADRAALRAMQQGKLIYTIAPRQMGKTSLMKRLAAQLERQGWYCCFLDLATFRNLERPRWFRHLGEAIARDRKLDPAGLLLQDQQDFRAFLLNGVGLGWSFNPARLALFFDEVEGLLELPFADDFLMTLRDMYQQRDSYPGRLLIAFAGSVDPQTLVRNPTISPFNVAEELALDDFTDGEALALTRNLSLLGLPVDDAVHQHIYDWTAGQPHLTQRVCEIIEGWGAAGQLRAIDADTVDRAVHSGLLAPRGRDKNIKHIIGEVEGLSAHPATLWRRLIAGEEVYATESGFYALYLTGAVTEGTDGRVRVRNPIYTRALERYAPRNCAQINASEEALRRALGVARRALALLEEQAAGFGPLHTPVHLLIEIEARRAEAERLEQALNTR